MLGFLTDGFHFNKLTWFSSAPRGDSVLRRAAQPRAIERTGADAKVSLANKPIGCCCGLSSGFVAKTSALPACRRNSAAKRHADVIGREACGFRGWRCGPHMLAEESGCKTMGGGLCKARIMARAKNLAYPADGLIFRIGKFPTRTIGQCLCS